MLWLRRSLVNSVNYIFLVTFRQSSPRYRCYIGHVTVNDSVSLSEKQQLTASARRFGLIEELMTLITPITPVYLIS